MTDIWRKILTVSMLTVSIWTVSTICTGAVQSASAQTTTTNNLPELYAADFLNIPLGARALGMGGQFSPIDNNDGTAFFWNPAALALMKGKYISTTYSNQFGSLGKPLSNYFHIGYSQDLGNGVGVSGNWIRNSIGNIPLTDDPALVGSGATGEFLRLIQQGLLDNGGATFSNNDDALFLSIAKTLINAVDFGWQYFRIPIEIPIGLTFKYVSQSFGGDSRVSYTGTGIGVDLGALIKFKFGDFVARPIFGDLALGATVRDVFNTPISWNTDLRTRASIPRAVVLSASYKQPLEFLSSSILIAFSRDTRYDGITSLGLEYRFRQLLALRVGSLERELTLGAGLFLFRAIFIDYAYQSSPLGAPHRIGLTINLAEWLQ
jgi:hypothetical protein